MNAYPPVASTNSAPLGRPGSGGTPTWTREEIEVRLAALAPFHHAIALPFGLSTYREADARHDRERTRLDSLKAHLWPRLLAQFGGTLAGKRVLDVACNCGGFSIEAANTGAAEVFGNDVDPHYIDQANFVRDVLGLDNVRFETSRLEDLDPERVGTFDIVFFFGILYHLPDPINALRRIATLTRDTLVIDTSMLRFRMIDGLVRWPLWRGKRVPAMRESDYDATTGRWRTADSYQFYPNRPAVDEALAFVGFDDVRFLKPTAAGLEPRYHSGKRATFIARRRIVDA